MFVCRFFLFHLFESPKFLLARGRQSEAVATVHGIAYKNKKKTWLSEEVLNAIGGDPEVVSNAKLSTAAIVGRFFSKFSQDRIGPLFATKRKDALILPFVMGQDCLSSTLIAQPVRHLTLHMYGLAHDTDADLLV